MNKIETIGDIKDGKLSIVNRKRFEEDLRQFKDCAVEIIIKKRGRRSSPQNRYYWGCVIKEIQIRLRELGNDFDQDTIHEYLKGKFNAEKVITPQAEVIEIGQSTAKMNKEEFMVYIDKIREWASDTLEIFIPDPSTQTQMFQS